jgi:hypothetical protein
VAPKATPRLVRSTARRVSPGDMVDQRAHHLKGSKDLPANLFGRTHASTDTRMPRSAYQATMG